MELKKFDLVFHIALKHVKDQSSLSRIILNQHKGLAANNVEEQEIKDLLNGKYQNSILVLMDGFDEYNLGLNKNIDSIFKRSSLWNSWLILTTRPFDKVDDLRPYFEAEAIITGFSDKSIDDYVSKFFRNEKTEKAFRAKVTKNQIQHILHIPLILQMMCILFQSGYDLPRSKTEATKAMVEWSIEYSGYRTCNPKTQGIKKEEMIFKLGKLAWESLQSDVQQLLLDKVCINMYINFTYVWLSL